MPSVGFYKKIILSALALLILIPTATAIVLYIQLRSLEAKKIGVAIAPDDSVTVGATQIEPAGIAREKPVLGYQMLYPDFKASFYGFNTGLIGRKAVFLTFDDGPSSGTAAILDALKGEGIQATFFVNGKSAHNLTAQLSRIVNEGHAIGMHSYSHRYNVIYSSMENFLDDFYRDFVYIKSETGIAPEIMRLPGGSINIFDIASYQQLIAEVLRRGFIYYDWNVSAGDAMKDATAQSIITNVLNGVRLSWGPAFVLMHDSGDPALRDSLGTIIDTLKSEGYEFRKIDNSVKPPMFIYPD